MSRDLDSLLNAREAAAVGEWLGDDKAAFHFMRDHPGKPNHSNFQPAFFLGKKAMIEWMSLVIAASPAVLGS